MTCIMGYLLTNLGQLADKRGDDTLACAGRSQEMIAAANYGLAQVAHGRGNLAEAQYYGQARLAIYEALGMYMIAEVRQWLVTLPAEGR